MGSIACRLLCALAAAGLAAPGLAAPRIARAAALADVFVDIHAAIRAAADDAQALDLATVAYAQRLMATDPSLAKIEAGQPGLTPYLADALRPVLERVGLRRREAYRDRAVATLRETFTPTEAVDVLAFCRSPVGRRLLTSVGTMYESRAAITSALRAGLISVDEAGASLEEVAGAALSEISLDDSAEIGRMAEAHPALNKIDLMTRRLGALRVAMEREPLSSPEQAAITIAIQAGVAAHAASFGK